MKQIKSHWRLAFRCLRKAISVTAETLSQNIRGRIYLYRTKPDTEAIRDIWAKKIYSMSDRQRKKLQETT